MSESALIAMFDSSAALAAFNEALAREGEHIYVPPHTDRGLAEATIRAYLCEPFQVAAKVMAPGFPFAEVGQSLSGFCIAKSAGYWLVYQPNEQRFLCFGALRQRIWELMASTAIRCTAGRHERCELSSNVLRACSTAGGPVTPNPSIERTSASKLRLLPVTAHVER